LSGLKLAGGGFAPFFELQEKVDALIERVNPDDEADIDRTVAEIRNLYAAYPWMPSAFRDLLNGKNTLPNNKLRVNLFNQSDGFMGDGIYREHFFGNTSMFNLILKAVSEQTRYSATALRWRKRANVSKSLTLAGL